MNLEKDLIVTTYRYPPLDLTAPYIGVKVTHKDTGITFESHIHKYKQQNLFECNVEIQRLVREFYSKHEIISFKYFKLIVEK